MPVNPYDDRKVSLRRPHGNGDLDIVRASYTRRKGNVTEALARILERGMSQVNPPFNWTSANSAELDQTPQVAASDQDRHCLLSEKSVKI